MFLINSRRVSDQINWKKFIRLFRKDLSERYKKTVSKLSQIVTYFRRISKLLKITELSIGCLRQK